MGFRINSQLFGVQTTQNSPISLSHWRRWKQNSGWEKGVLTVIRQEEPETYFYPQSIIEREIEQRGGRDGYVYKEGFSLDGAFGCLREIVSFDVRGWEPRVSSSYLQTIRELTICQPGVDIWRMLCFALDNEHPELFLRNTLDGLVLRVPSRGQVLYVGNHRALFALISGIPVLRVVNVAIPLEARLFLNSLGNMGIASLAQSFIDQVQELEQEP